MEQYTDFVSLIPEFFFDLIARLIPGSYAIGLYMHFNVSPTPAMSLYNLIGLIIASYVVGYTIDRFVDGLLSLIPPYNPDNKVEFILPFPIKSDWLFDPVFKKYMAELVMMRSFAAISLGYAIYIYFTNQTVQLSFGFLITLFILFTVCYLFGKRDWSKRFAGKYEPLRRRTGA